MILFQFEGEDTYFENPIKIVQATNPNEITQKLEEIEQLVNMGYYAAGYLSYEAAAAFHPTANIKSGCNMPLLWFAIFTSKSEFAMPYKLGDFKTSDWRPNTDYDHYKNGFKRIKKEIEEGNTYQVNYTFRIRTNFDGNDFALYKQLSKAQNAKYSAYLDTGRFRILSVSPELFFKWEDGHITTRPMKGTAQRGNNAEEDKANKERLFQSDKDRSENLMIVDLLRNDLGKIAEIGSVAVPKIYEIEEYPTVLQMTSTVTAKTLKNISFSKLFSAIFPCGSITGAPKLSTMNIISEIESEPREVYCGAVGYFTPTKKAVFNVPIRTCLIDSETGVAEYSVGGAITWDSEVKEEFNECFVKAKILTKINPSFQLLETIRMENGQYELLQEHLNRLANSAAFFHIPIDLLEIKNELQKHAQAHKTGLHKVRLIVSKQRNIHVESSVIEEIKDVKIIYLARQPIISQNDFLYHKTTNRKAFVPFKKEGFFDCLLWNERNELTEFTTGNVILQFDKEYLTPPIFSGLLPGVMRETLLAKGKLKEQVLTTEDLRKADKIWYINSVRGWVEVSLDRCFSGH